MFTAVSLFGALSVSAQDPATARDQRLRDGRIETRTIGDLGRAEGVVNAPWGPLLRSVADVRRWPTIFTFVTAAHVQSVANRRTFAELVLSPPGGAARRMRVRVDADVVPGSPSAHVIDCARLGGDGERFEVWVRIEPTHGRVRALVRVDVRLAPALASRTPEQLARDVLVSLRVHARSLHR